ncbi:MAG: tetratricopeptide repeat protein [Chloroflexi bacterium]|nr:tetratricopeptide repeat protein [Chloroflexota bacterium]
MSTVVFSVYYYFDRYSHSNQAVVEYQLENVEAVVREHPQSAELRVAAANYYLESGLIPQSIQQSEQALVIEPDNQGALILLASAYQKTGNLDAAIERLNRVIALNQGNALAKIDPRLESVHYVLGTLYTKQGRYAEAIASLKLALEISSTDADALYALGVAYQKQDDHTHALEAFQEAIRFAPEFGEAYADMAESAIALGNAPEAMYARAMVLLLNGQPANAAAQFEQVIAQAPEIKRAYYGLGLANEKLGKHAEAIQALSEFVKIYPNDIAAQQALGRLMRGN